METSPGEMQRQPIARVQSAAYVGDTDAHQCVQYVEAIAKTLLHMLLDIRAQEARATCQELVAQALLWAETANLADPTREARWYSTGRLDNHLAPIEQWLRVHEDAPAASALQEAWDALNELSNALFSDLDVVFQLNALGLITDREMWEGIREFEGEAGIGSEIPDLLTNEDLRDYLERVRDAAADLPQP